jgi:hypothetical protein
VTATLAKFFDDVAAGSGLGPPVDRATVAELRADLAVALEDIAARLPPDAPTLSLTKGRIRAVLACETGALAANEIVAEVTPAMMLGQLVDRLVASYVVTGAVPAEPFEHAIEALHAERDERAVAWLDGAEPEVIRDLRADLADRARRVGSSWPLVSSEWWPRPEDGVRVPFADGRIVLSGRFDLMLGGRPTPLDRVVVEVKSGAATGVHQPDLYWYGLLGALRDGTPPRAVAVWSAADGVTTTAPISADGLRSAAMRVVDAAERWIALLGGREPTITAHPGCRWCALLEVCETGQRWSPDGALDDDRLDDDDHNDVSDEADG